MFFFPSGFCWFLIHLFYYDFPLEAYIPYPYFASLCFVHIAMYILSFLLLPYPYFIVNIFIYLSFFCFFFSFSSVSFQNDFSMGLDLSEARASLLSGDVVELTNATSPDSTSMKLVWEVGSLDYSTEWPLYLLELHYLNIFIRCVGFVYCIWCSTRYLFVWEMALLKECFVSRTTENQLVIDDIAYTQYSKTNKQKKSRKIL